VLRVPTADGPVWFKASAAALAHDGPVTEALARIRPDAVLTPLALDVERGWLLLPDGGETLRQVRERERDPRRWIEAFALYAELQIAAAPRVDELVSAGLPDQRLARIPELARDLGVDDAELLCEQLAAFGIPESVQHDDFHDSNVFVVGDGCRIFDWGDACASHPFCSLTVGLRAFTYWRELGAEDPDVQRAREAYLEPWEGFAARGELRQAAALAERLGMLVRALTYRRIQLLSPEAHDEYGESASSWLQDFLAAG
jgi:Ser/Thr protein kinase RdoA (MazF antagonist)